MPPTVSFNLYFPSQFVISDIIITFHSSLQLLDNRELFALLKKNMADFLCGIQFIKYTGKLFYLYSFWACSLHLYSNAQSKHLLFSSEHSLSKKYGRQLLFLSPLWTSAKNFGRLLFPVNELQKKRYFSLEFLFLTFDSSFQSAFQPCTGTVLWRRILNDKRRFSFSIWAGVCIIHKMLHKPLFGLLCTTCPFWRQSCSHSWWIKADRD